MSSMEKSALLRMQEAQLVELDQQIKQVRTTIKSHKTRLNKMQTKIDQIRQEVFSQMSKMEERLLSIVGKIQGSMKKLKADKRLDPEIRDDIAQMIEGLLEGFSLEGETMEEQFLRQAEAREKARSNDAFAPFRVAPDKEERKDIRKIYLELSKQFHPDKASTAAEKKTYRHLQQQIIEAYELGDYQALLDLQNMNQTADLMEREDFTEATDALAHRIAVRQQQLRHLELQKDRLSQEIKALRKSGAGQMLTDVDGMARMGLSLEETLGVDSMDEFIASLEQYHNALEDTLRLGHLSPQFVAILAEEEFDMEGEFEDFLLDFGIEHLDDLFDFEEEELIFNDKAKFKENSLVELKGGFKLFMLDDLGSEYYAEKDGLSGKVEESLLEEGTNHPIYTIRLDSKSLNQLHPDYCRTVVAEGRPLDILVKVPERHLKKKIKKRRESVHTQVKAARKLELKYRYEHLEPGKFKLLERVLLADVTQEPEANWLTYFSTHFSLPRQLITLEATNIWKANQVVTLHEAIFDFFADELMATVEWNGQDYEAPLSFFTAEKNDPIYKALEVYHIWLDGEQEMPF